MHRRKAMMRLVGGTMLGAVAVSTSRGSVQERFPIRPIRLLVGFAAGGATDLSARIVADAMRSMLGQSMVVENRPGANGAIAIRNVATTKADGYTLIFATNGNLTVAPARYRKLPYDVGRDLAPIGTVVGYSHVLTVPAQSPFHDLKAVIKVAKQSPLSISSVGQTDEMAIALFRNLSGVKLNNVPYQGQSAVLNDLISGRIDMSFLAPTVAAPLIQTGKVRALAVTGKNPISELIDIPTMHDAGVRSFEMEIWNSILAPMGTSPEVLDVLGKSLRQVLSSPAVQKKLATNGLIPLIETPEEFSKRISAEGTKWKSLALEENMPLLD